MGKNPYKQFSTTYTAKSGQWRQDHGLLWFFIETRENRMPLVFSHRTFLEHGATAPEIRSGDSVRILYVKHQNKRFYTGLYHKGVKVFHIDGFTMKKELLDMDKLEKTNPFAAANVLAIMTSMGRNQ